MEIRRARLDGHVEHFLDGAIEAGEIDACTSMTLRLYGDAVMLRNIVDANHPGKDWRGRLTNGIELAHYASALLPELPEGRRGALIFEGIGSLSHSITELAKVLADWAATDETEGGAMKPFLRKRSHLHTDGRIFKRTARKLHSPSWIRRYIKHTESSEARHLRRVAAIAFGRLSLSPQASVVSGRSLIMTDMNQQLQWSRADYAATHNDEIAAAIRRVDGIQTPRLITDSRRKLLKRAAVIAAGLLGASTVGALARGEQILIEGSTAILQVQKRTSLAEIGHGHLAVSILDKAKLPLAELCIYLDNTPTIDQVSGFALWMQSGLEAELLSKANIISMTEDGRNHPLFIGRQKRNGDLAIQNQMLADIVGRSPWHGNAWEQHRARIDKYWKDTGDIWTQTLTVFVLGARMAKRFPLSRNAP